MGRKLTYEDVKKFIESLGYELLSEKYKNSDEKLILKDNYGYYYLVNLNNLKYNNNIPSKFHKYNPYTIQNIKLWCKLNNKPFELLSTDYKNNNIKLQWKCLEDNCEEIFMSNWADISSNHGCPYCSGHKVGLSNCLATKRPDLIKEWHLILNNSLTPFDVTVSSGKNVWWKCSRNPKHEWPTTVYNRAINNSGCPYCFGRYVTEDHNLLIVNPELANEWDYEKNDKKPEEYCPSSGEYAWWICKECKHKWYSQIANRNNNIGCPECSKSKGEKECKRILISKEFIEVKQGEYNDLSDSDLINNIYFIQQKEFDKLIGLGGKNLSYDFYLSQYNLLIEYQGIQHEKYIPGFHKSYDDFLKQLEHDRLKKEYALINNINLLEIWYYDFDNIEEILDRELNSLIIQSIAI